MHKQENKGDNMKILITGGTGNVGSVVVGELLKRAQRYAC